jgi:hypothetical protein
LEQARDAGRVDLFNRRRRAAVAPALNAERRVSVPGFEIA